MFPGNRKKIAKSKQFKYAKEEQTGTKIKPTPVWSSSLLSNVNSICVSCIKRKYRVSLNKRQCFSEVFGCVIFTKDPFVSFQHFSRQLLPISVNP